VASSSLAVPGVVSLLRLADVLVRVLALSAETRIDRNESVSCGLKLRKSVGDRVRWGRVDDRVLEDQLRRGVLRCDLAAR
jgi:hypothetical protein